MSVSFSLSQTMMLQCLATWASVGGRDTLDELLDYSSTIDELRRLHSLYRDGKLPLSELRRQHRKVCDLLVVAARHYPGLRDYAYSYPSWERVTFDFLSPDRG